MIPSASVLVPTTTQGCAHRTRARDFVLARYDVLHPRWQVIEGECPGNWSKGAAIHRAFEQSTSDVLVLADADSYVDADVLADAVERCHRGVPWVMPHRSVYRLTEDETTLVLDGHRPRIEKVVRFPYHGPAGGGVVVMTRAAYVAVNGIDERFEGWGGEDISLGMALHTLTGPHERLTSDLIHLWHPHPAPHGRGSPESEALAGRYKAAVGDRTVMTALVEEHHGPAASHDADGDRVARLDVGAT